MKSGTSKKPSNFPLKARVEVEWLDSFSNSGWDTLESYKKHGGPALVRSIGYVLEDTSELITLVQSKCNKNGDVADAISIPKGCVLRVAKVTGGLI